MLNSPDRPLYTAHLRAGQSTWLSEPPEDKNELSPPDPPCSPGLSLWPPESLQDSSAPALQTNPAMTHINQSTAYLDTVNTILPALVQKHKSKYKPHFSQTGPVSCEVWHWKQLQQVTMSWDVSEHATAGSCEAASCTLTFCTNPPVCLLRLTALTVTDRGHAEL